MNTQHTMGTLEFNESPHEANRFGINVFGHNWLMSILHNGMQLVEVQRANMRRLVACWNACDGIATEKLEKVAGDTAPVFALLMETATERDALLAAITRLANAAFARDTTMGDQCGLFAAQAELRDATKIARAAIASATIKGVPTC